MIQQINSTNELKDCLTHKIEDAGLEIAVDPLLSETEFIGVKVDDYYMGLHLGGETPKAVDFIVSVDCQCDAYVLYILELKKVRSPKAYTTENIIEKFETAIERFMKTEFSNIFLNDKYKYKDVKLYLVTTAYGNAMGQANFEAYYKLLAKTNKKDTLVNDCKLSSKYFRFRNFVRRIERNTSKSSYKANRLKISKS